MLVIYSKFICVCHYFIKAGVVFFKRIISLGQAYFPNLTRTKYYASLKTTSSLFQKPRTKAKQFNFKFTLYCHSAIPFYQYVQVWRLFKDLW